MSFEVCGEPRSGAVTEADGCTYLLGRAAPAAAFPNPERNQ